MPPRKRTTPKRVTLKPVSSALDRVHRQLRAQRKIAASPAIQRRLDLKIRKLENLVKYVRDLCNGETAVFIPPFFAQKPRQK